MATLQKFSRVISTAKLTNKSSLGALISVRNHWNKDFKPGPYPVTQKEREVAAKKYGIPIEEYQPYPDDGLGYGDYPQLPNITKDIRDNNYPWDYPEHKRNFNEPIHVNSDLYSEDRWNNCKKKLPQEKNDEQILIA